MASLVWRYLKRRPYLIVGAVVLQIFVAFLQIYLLYLTKPIIDQGVAAKDFELVLGFAFVMILLAGGIMVMSFAVSVISARLASRVGAEIRQDLYDRVMSMPAPDKCTRDTSDTMVRMTTDVNAVQEYTRLLVTAVLFVPPMMFLMLWMVFEISTWACAAMLVSFVAVVLFMIYSGLRIRRMVDDVQVLMDGVTGMFRDSASGARAIRAYGRGEQEMKRFSDYHSVFVKKGTKYNNNTYFYPILAIAIINFVLVMVYNRGGITVGDFDMSVAELSLIVQLWGCLIGCLAVVPFITGVAPKYAVGKRRILEILDAPAEEASEPVRAESSDAIRFESATLGIGGKPVAGDVDLAIRRGEVTVMVGLKGPMRRAMVAAIAGTRPPSSGRVLVDGLEVDGPEDARGSISIVSDRVMILRDSMRENISMGRDISDEEIAAVCSDACMDDVIAGLPEGLDTDFASCGLEFSDGQRQRLVIARSLAKPAGIRVFDECFHSIDPLVESKLVGNIMARCKGDTVLFITGDILQASLADRVLFFDGGRLAGDGTHEELLRTCPEYAAMRRLQEGARWTRDSTGRC
ncbi:MAG: ABC transporter ATP-binding protein [Thermoplasmata archaeon]|nr:ABC transporter ATP-binding protein [Thermoplasmata archaeon]